MEVEVDDGLVVQRTVLVDLFTTYTFTILDLFTTYTYRPVYNIHVHYY